MCDVSVVFAELDRGKKKRIIRAKTNSIDSFRTLKDILEVSSESQYML